MHVTLPGKRETILPNHSREAKTVNIFTAGWLKTLAQRSSGGINVAAFDVDARFFGGREAPPPSQLSISAASFRIQISFRPSLDV